MTLSRSSTSILASCCLVWSLITTQQTALAQCDSTTCDECLGGFNCVWNKDGSCAGACQNFPNIDCYSKRTFGGYDIAANICDAAANRTDANENCFAQSDSVSCLRQTDCGWFRGNVAASGADGGWCALDLALINKPPACSAATCDECLADSNCVWNPTLGDMGECMNSCNDFPNVDCYYPRIFGATQADVLDICVVANNNETVMQNEMCFNRSVQESCFSLAEARCAWNTGTLDDESGNSSGWCILYLQDAVSSGSAAWFSHLYYVWMTMAMGAAASALFLV